MALSIQSLTVKRNGTAVLQHLSCTVPAGQVLAVTGASGSGKTTLLEAIAGRLIFSGTISWDGRPGIALVQQQHQFRNLSHTSTFYYQQRFNTADSDDAQTVAEVLPDLFCAHPEQHQAAIRQLFNLDELQHRRLLHLSNGENKRLQLAKALLLQPGLLLLDHPFLGLDSATRAMLEGVLQQLAANGTTIVFTCPETRVPAVADAVLHLQAGTGEPVPAARFAAAKPQLTAFDTQLLQQLVQQDAALHFNDAVRMQHVQVRYGSKQVLQDINWQVRQGERWSLSGPNGAGKSTLLSLITADNPQAYANELCLFDRRRGSGESIWDIKCNIGFVSPELHLHFDRGATVREAVASGLFDTIGLFRQPSTEQELRVDGWLRLLQLHPHKQQPLWQLPLGTQRLALLARALIKQPPLLVLDEPMQGLDEAQGLLLRAAIEHVCAHSSQTLIYVSHYTEDLPGCIDHYLRLEAGRIVRSSPDP